MARLPLSDFLTRDEELALALRWRDHGDERALHRLVLAHAPLVAKIARRFKASKRILEDLIQEGNVGLLIAAQKFDPSRDLRFATYAQWWVKAAVAMAAFKLPNDVKPSFTNRNRTAFFKGQNPILTLSLDTLLGPEAGGMTLGDTLESDWAGPLEITEQAIDGERLNAILNKAIASLPERASDIMKSRYLLEEAETLEAVGRRHGVSKERIRQIEVASLAKVADKVRKAVTV